LVAPARNRAEEYRFGSITGSTQLIGDAEDEVDQVVLARPVNDPNNATRRKIGVVFQPPGSEPGVCFCGFIAGVGERFD
jgi:hypothetical protein